MTMFKVLGIITAMLLFLSGCMSVQFHGDVGDNATVTVTKTTTVSDAVDATLPLM